ncbi:hypothetical protein GCM10009677_13670 [Sphaerisporangium rubeum]
MVRGGGVVLRRALAAVSMRAASVDAIRRGTLPALLTSMPRVASPGRAHHYGALLLTSVHGILGMEASGQLTREKWRTDADEILETLLGALPPTDRLCPEAI